MILRWMVWAVLVTGIVGLAARIVETVLRDSGRPTRWTWLAAMSASLAIQAWSLLRPRLGPVAAPPESVLHGLESFHRISSSLPTLPERYVAALLGGWALAAAILTTGLVAGLAILRLRAARWRPARVEGDDDVLVSEDFGPALVGVWSPRIVLPRWALRMAPDELRLAYRHEAEHRDAQDTRLLFATALAVALVPWNPVLWWHVRRLRAAVEVDCDRRVLRSGASRRAYGRLLLHMGSARSRYPVPVLALARSEALLERRLKMIVRDINPTNPLRTFVAIGAAAVLVVAACGTPTPTTATVMTAAEASELAPGDQPTVFVDGEEHRGILSTLDPAAIERIDIVKGDAAIALFGPEASAGVIQIFTKARHDESGLLR